MEDMERIQMIDLHMHSTFSDGTDSVEELLQNVRRSGITYFSLTDHDTIEGARAMEELVPDDMTFIRGIEFSSITDVGKCHILGYGCDWNNKGFLDLLEEGNVKRRNKLEKRILFLHDEYGIDIEEEQLAKLRAMKSVGKPHLGNLLVAMGLSDNKDEAIEKYINPCKTESDRIDGRKVIKAILSSGGIPVWAHPLGGTGESEKTHEYVEKQLEVLMGAGIKGLECYYSRYTMAQVKLLVELAKKNGLYISGGSDYHGKNKTVMLGELNAEDVSVTSDMLTVLKALK